MLLSWLRKGSIVVAMELVNNLLDWSWCFLHAGAGCSTAEISFDGVNIRLIGSSVGIAEVFHGVAVSRRVISWRDLSCNGRPGSFIFQDGKRVESLVNYLWGELCICMALALNHFRLFMVGAVGIHAAGSVFPVDSILISIGMGYLRASHQWDDSWLIAHGNVFDWRYQVMINLDCSGQLKLKPHFLA